MKAVRIYAHGGGGQLRYEDAADPHLRSDSDVIVKLEAAAVNRVDLPARPGTGLGPNTVPRIPGADGAGTIVSIGTNVRRLKPGDPVCLYPIYGCEDCHYCNNKTVSLCSERRLLGERDDGTYAEYVRVPALNCFSIPNGLSFEEAAAFPLVYLMAWRMVITRGDLKPGETIWIVGAGGGIATAALQIAAAVGARVIVSSRHQENLSAAKKFGAEYGILHSDSHEQAKSVRSLTSKRGVDVVVNCVGGETWSESFAALARGGRLITCGAIAGRKPKTDLRRVFWNHLKIFSVGPGTRQEFVRLLDFFAATGRKPIIDRVFPLQDALSAQRRLEEGRQFGKIILHVGA